MTASAQYEYWTDDEVKLLAITRIKHHNKYFTGSRGNCTVGWAIVVDELQKNGLSRNNNNKIRKKWTDINIWYKKLKEPSKFDSGKGTENGEETAADSELFLILDEFYTGKHTLQPPLIADSSMVENLRATEPEAATGQSNYVGLAKRSCSTSTTLPDAYLAEQPSTSQSTAGFVVVSSSSEDDEGEVTMPPPTQARASKDKRCADYYKVKPKPMKAKDKKEKKDDWFRDFLAAQAERRRVEHNELITVLSSIIPKSKE